MGLDDDLAAAVLSRVMPGRPVRSYPALVSTEADAMAWARSGAPHGAVVAADYQVSPRGRGGLPWTVQPGRGLVFSLVLRPTLTAAREGWLYIVAVCGLADALGKDTTIVWPDEVRLAGQRVGAVGVWAEPALARVAWAVVNVFVPGAAPPRAPLVARIVTAVERRLRTPEEQVLAEFRSRCETFGRKVRARLIPMGPAGPRVQGLAVDALISGALTVETADGRRTAVWPQNLGILDDLDEEG